jgi:hypothetical protein
MQDEATARIDPVTNLVEIGHTDRDARLRLTMSVTPPHPSVPNPAASRNRCLVQIKKDCEMFAKRTGMHG